MASIRQRITRVLLRDERQQLASAVHDLAELRHFQRAPQTLGEIDSQLLDLALQQQGYTRVGGGGSMRSVEQMFPESLRAVAVNDARTMYHMDVMVTRAVEMWTDFGLGQHVTVTPNDPKLAEVFDEFWAALRNRPVLGDAAIHENSIRVLVDGETFWTVTVSTLDGQCAIRRLDTDRVSAILTLPDDPDTPLWYVVPAVGGDIYYPDWRAVPDDLSAVPLPLGARSADTLRPATRVVIVPLQRNRIGRRGWPQVAQSLVWARAYRDFIGDRATVAKKAAMHVEKLTVKNAGQSAVDNIVARLQSTLVNTDGPDRHADTAAGQTWVQNDNADLQWMSRDTGASAAQIDGLTIAAQFAAGAGVPLHWLGRSDAMQNRAVAKESSLPWYEQIQRYQTFWSAGFSDLCEVIGRMANEHGSAKIDDFSCEVGLDSPFNNDVDEIASVMGAVSAAVSAGSLDAESGQRATDALTRLALQSLGLRDSGAVMDAPEDETDAPPAADNGLPTESAVRELARAIDRAQQKLGE